MSKTILFLFVFLFHNLPAIGQTANHQLPGNGESLQDLIPHNWEILSKTEGDLNNDTIPDLVFVIKDTDPDNIITNEATGIGTIDTNPRILGIYFGNKGSDDYQKIQQSNTFIIHRQSPNMAEPFSEIQINEDGTLEIGFAIWSTAGSWGRTTLRYNFMYRNQHFVLCNFNRTEIHRGSGNLKSYRINFLEGNMEIEDGHISSDEPESIEKSEFTLDTLHTLETLKEPLKWDFQDIQI